MTRLQHLIELRKHYQADPTAKAKLAHVDKEIERLRALGTSAAVKAAVTVARAVVIAAIFCARAFAAIPGVPEINPGVTAPMIVSWSNDFFGFPASGSAKENDPNDDHRTNSFSFLGRHRGWQMALDDSMLTDKGAGVRTDELTATLGRTLGPVTVGAGVRSRRGYGGQDVQNWFHQWTNDTSLHLEREESGETAVAYAVAHLPRYQIDRRLSLDPLLAVAASSSGESAEDLGIRVVYNGDLRNCWLGVRYQWRDGADTPLTRSIEKHERGLRLDYGIARHKGFSFSVLYAPEHRAGVGTFAWSF